jgi:hypothetical protein
MTGTRLDTFMRSHDIRPAQLARVAYVSRQHLFQLREGNRDPSRHIMVRLMLACRLILRRAVRLDELFDLTETGL